MTTEEGVQFYKNQIDHPSLTDKQARALIGNIIYLVGMGDEVTREIMTLESLSLITPKERHTFMAIQMAEREEMNELKKYKKIDG